MSAATIFSACNLLALLGWAGLLTTLFVPRLRHPVWLATGLALPAVFAAVYLVTLGLAVATGPNGGGFNSIPQVRALFASDFGVTTGWVHYLAFDLFVGTWIARGGLAAGLSRWALLPLLILTFLFGPLGFLGFVVLHAATGRGRPTMAGEAGSSRFFSRTI